MGSVHKLLCNYGVGIKQSESYKQNQNPAECRIQEIKGTNPTVLNRSGSLNWSWLLCMEYVIYIPNCMAHHSLSWSTPRLDSFGFTTDVTHLIEFELWEPILIIVTPSH